MKNFNPRIAALFFAALCSSGEAQTLEERVATLEREVAALKKALASNQDGEKTNAPQKAAGASISVKLANKRASSANFQDQILWDTTFTLSGINKPTRAVKGVLLICDLFDEPKVKVQWTITEPLSPGNPHTEKSKGIDFNQFRDDHRWLLGTDLKDIKARFEIEEVIYQ